MDSFTNEQTVGCELRGFLKLESKCMRRLLEQLSDHKRGQLPRSAGTLRQCGKTRAQHLSVCKLPTSAASDFPPVSFPTQREPRDTRHPACLPHEKPLSASFLYRIWQDRHQSRNARLGSVRRFQPCTKSSFFAYGELTKAVHSEGLHVITFQTGFRQPRG